MDDYEKQQELKDIKINRLLDDSLATAEASYGPDSVEVAISLENYAQFLRERKLRTLDAANMKARADVIRAKHQPTQQSPVQRKTTTTLSKVVVKTYRGSQSEVTAAFQVDATKMASQGYFPISQTWAPGTWGCGAFVLALLLCFLLIGVLIFIFMLVVKPAGGTLTVTYELRELAGPAPAVASSEPPAEKTCPSCAEQVKAAAKVCRFCQHNF
jgi:hypothetical protein